MTMYSTRDPHPYAWYTHPAYQRFWDHYASVMSWSHWQRQSYQSPHSHNAFPGYNGRIPRIPTPRKYESMHNNTRGGQFSHESSKRHFSPRTESNPRPRPMAPRSPRQKVNLKRARLPTPESESRSDSMEIEISEDMKEFLLKTQQYREERDARKAAAAEADREDTRVDATASVHRLKATISEDAPKERPGVRRTFEMKQLYGPDAAKIHGMETAMQLTFDRNCDRFQPKLWPIMPFNIKFA